MVQVEQQAKKIIEGTKQKAEETISADETVAWHTTTSLISFQTQLIFSVSRLSESMIDKLISQLEQCNTLEEYIVLTQKLKDARNTK